VARFDINTGKLLETNDTFANLVGFRPHELQGMSCRLLFPTRCLKARTLCRQFMLEQEADSVEANSTLLTRSGVEVDVQLTTFCLRTQSGVAAQCLLLCTPVPVSSSSPALLSTKPLLVGVCVSLCVCMCICVLAVVCESRCVRSGLLLFWFIAVCLLSLSLHPSVHMSSSHTSLFRLGHLFPFLGVNSDRVIVAICPQKFSIPLF
jgi:PAS domain S-box-containing protein